MIPLLSAGAWTMLAFVAIAVFSAFAWMNLRSNIRKIDYPEPGATTGDDTTK